MNTVRIAKGPSLRRWAREASLYASLVILDTGAADNLVRFSRLADRISLLVKHGCPRVEIYPANARFEFGGGRMGDACLPAKMTAGLAGITGSSAAVVSESEIPA